MSGNMDEMEDPERSWLDGCGEDVSSWENLETSLKIRDHPSETRSYFLFEGLKSMEWTSSMDSKNRVLVFL